LLTELKPKNLEDVDSQPLSLLPKNFDYYAGGHPHFVFSEKIKDYGIISYPGPLFPNNFKELEELHNGGFFIVEDNNVSHILVNLFDVGSITITADHKSPEKVDAEINSEIEKRTFQNKIVTLRISGILETGKPSDINFSNIYSILKAKGAYAILKNSSALSSKEFEQVNVELSSTEEIESKLITEHITNTDIDDIDAEQLARTLMNILDTSKQEGETVYTFEKRLKDEMDKILG
jgi:DNA repair protein SbcD/Mre11